MKKKIFLSALLCIAMLIAFPAIVKAANDTVSFNVTVTNDYTSAYEVLNLVNKERKSAGLNELKMDKDLLEAAMIRAGELSLDFSHTRPDGTSCFTLSNKAFAENIAAGYSNPEYVMQGWMESPGHKSNILGQGYKTIGIGAIKYGNLCYWVQLFGYNNLETNASKPKNKQVTNSIAMLSKNVELYYNSISDYGKRYYPNGFETQIVVLNPGWQGRCVTVDPSQLTYSSSNKSIKINSKGLITADGAGETTITAKLKQDGTKYVSQKVKITEQISNLKIGNINDVTYTGKNITPNIVIKDGNYTLVKDKDYKLSYSNNKSCGTATVTVTGIGGYTGQVTKNFKINLQKVTGVKFATSTSDSITIKWNKVGDATGYKIYIYDYSKNEYQYYKKTSATDIKIKNLNPNTKYKFKVKAYKEVNGVQYCGARSDAYKTITSPKVVTNVKVKWTANNMIKFSWDKVSGATKYKVYVYNSKTNSYEYYGKTESTSIKVKNLQPNTKYKIKVRAYRTYDGVQHLGDKSSYASAWTKDYVYRTPKGERYHLDPDCGGKNSYEVTLNKAKSKGLTPCQKCAK